MLVNILQKNCIKSQKAAAVAREGFFISYTSENIYRVYFPETNMVKINMELGFQEPDTKNQSLNTQPCDKILFFYLDIKLINIPAYNQASTPSAIEISQRHFDKTFAKSQLILKVMTASYSLQIQT